MILNQLLINIGLSTIVGIITIVIPLYFNQKFKQFNQVTGQKENKQIHIILFMFMLANWKANQIQNLKYKAKQTKI